MEWLVVFSAKLSEEVLQASLARMRDMGLELSVSHGETQTVVGARSANGSVAAERIERLAGVQRVVHVSPTYRLALRTHQSTDTVITVKGVRIGNPHLTVIAGPCTVENHDDLMTVARCVKQSGAHVLRGGAFKSRSSPYSFQGLGREGLEILKQAGQAVDMPTITEVTDPRDVDIVAAHADILQIGSRNMQNAALLTEAGQTQKPVLLKRGFAASIDEWLMSAEYVLNQGNHRVILCERGIRTFNQEVRFTLDVSAVPVVAARSHLPVIVDPSHAAGDRAFVAPLALAGIAAGAAGVMVEVHAAPDRALCDGPQALVPDEFATLVKRISEIKKTLRETRQLKSAEPVAKVRSL